MNFDELGIPFPLFKAPTKETGNYAGIGTCCLCNKANAHCFELSIGCALIIPCPHCDTTNGLDAHDRKNVDCRKCRQEVPFPENASEKTLSCYECLRSGRAAITKDTALGMIPWADLFRSDLASLPRAKDRAASKIPIEAVHELLRTPTYNTWQGEKWQFCCQAPMTYIGCWTNEEFGRHSPVGQEEEFFRSVVIEPVEGLWEGELGCDFYTFQCSRCKAYRAHWDLD